MTNKNPNTLADNAFKLHDWLTVRLDDLLVPQDKRILIAVSCYDLVYEHQLAVACLVRSAIYGSAFALARPIFEAYVRGVWLKNCATEVQLQHFVEDKTIYFEKILTEIELLDGFRNGALSALKKDAWAAMNSYTHGGVQQAARRLNGNFIEPNYTEAEITNVLRIADAFSILAFQQVAAEADRLDLAEESINKLSSVIDDYRTK
jgi:hypothetical protein